MRLSPNPIRRKAKPYPSFVAHDCIVLAVDTAERSGWALYDCGELVDWGEIEMLRGGLLLSSLCHRANSRTLCGEPLPCVLVYERPFAGSTQGQYQGAWKMAFLAAGGAKRRMVGVYPATWRARVTGLARAGRDLARKGEQRRAERETGGKPCGPDAAAAICIGLWARYAGEVGATLPKPKPPKPAPAPRKTVRKKSTSETADLTPT